MPSFEGNLLTQQHQIISLESRDGREFESMQQMHLHIDYCVHQSLRHQKCVQAFAKHRHCMDVARKSNRTLYSETRRENSGIEQTVIELLWYRSMTANLVVIWSLSTITYTLTTFVVIRTYTTCSVLTGIHYGRLFASCILPCARVNLASYPRLDRKNK